MNAEYLLLNIIILLGPLLLSFDKRVHFFRYWSYLLPAIISAMIPFILWDIMVTDRHWYFNDAFTLPLRLFNLPLGEWLFFITVPYACIFTWEVMAAYFSNRKIEFPAGLQYIGALIFIICGTALFFTAKEYTAIVLTAMGFIIVLDALLKTQVFRQSRTYMFSGLLLIMMLVFNGYLTGRPVVLYNPVYQLDFRIFTIPIEDFFYGFALIFLVLIIYTKLKDIKYG